VTTPNDIAASGMETHDLLSDQEFLGRRTISNRAEKQFEALQMLAHVFSEPPQAVLQKLVDIAVEFCGADSSGISLEEADESGNLRFRWVAIAGSFSQYLHGTTPRFFSPCGTCLSTGRPQHYRVTKPYYDFLGVTAEPINDGMLIPWNSDQSRGTIWAISHGSRETFTPDDYKLLNTLADFAGISVRLAERQERTSSLRQLSAELLRARDEERRKIARDLHDSVGQYLAALKMNFSRLRKCSPSAIAEILTDSENLVDQCSSETRTMSYLLHPPLLDESGLRSAAEWYLDGFSERSGIEVVPDIDQHLGRLPREVETTLFRVLQESLTNVHRYSESKKVDVQIQRINNGDEVLLTVRDYGRGFSAQQLRDTNQGRSRGVGLTGLRERIAALSGTLEVVSAQPGASINVRLPLAPNPIAPNPSKPS
jgi:signal transduction histidine kinase